GRDLGRHHAAVRLHDAEFAAKTDFGEARFQAADIAADLRPDVGVDHRGGRSDRKSTRLNSSHVSISYAVFCLKKKSTGIRWRRGLPVARTYQLRRRRVHARP